MNVRFFCLDTLKGAFQSGRIIAYPTEAVYGLGCDPANQQAVQALLALKQRPQHKGMILVAGDLSQLTHYVDLQRIPSAMKERIFASWPGPVTWLLPKTHQAPEWITGDSDMVAVRVSAHPLVQAMCESLGSAMVSTSANLSGQPPIMQATQITAQFADQVFLVEGELGGSESPSQIRHGISGAVIRN